MLGKIDPQSIARSNGLSSLTPSAAKDGFNFQSILREKMDDSKPLEKIVIAYLLRIIEKTLSEDNGEEDTLFLPPLFPVSLSKPKKTIPGPASIAESFIPEARPEISNNLRGSQNIDSMAQEEGKISPEIEQPAAEPQITEKPSAQPTFPKSGNNGQDKFDHIVKEAGEKYGVPPSLIRAIIQVESSGNPKAISPAGAKGLMQLMTRTAADLGVTDPFDPAQNIMAGTKYLRQLPDRYQGDVKLALAAYNWGMGNLESQPHAIPRQVRNYIARIENHLASFGKS